LVAFYYSPDDISLVIVLINLAFKFQLLLCWRTYTNQMLMDIPQHLLHIKT